MSEISDLIKKLAGTLDADTVHLIECSVNSVDEDNRLAECTPLSDSFEGILESVYLSAQPNDGIIQIPVINSIVKVCICNSIDYPFIIQFSDLDKVIILADTSIQFNDGAFDGLVKVSPLVDKINALEEQINDILTTLKNTTIPLAPSGTYPFAPLYASINPILPITAKSDLENDKITHG